GGAAEMLRNDARGETRGDRAGRGGGGAAGGSEANRFLAEREGGGAVGRVGAEGERAARGDAVADRGAEQVGLADELRGVSGGGLAVDFAGRGDLFEVAGAKQCDAIRERHGFFPWRTRLSRRPHIGKRC